MSDAPNHQNCDTKQDFRAKMDKRAAMLCDAVTTAYLHGRGEHPGWENLLRETADNLGTLVAYIRERRRDGHADTKNPGDLQCAKSPNTNKA